MNSCKNMIENYYKTVNQTMSISDRFTPINVNLFYLYKGFIKIKDK